MNADEFFNRHSLEEIHKKTKISPVSLKLIKNKEFEKIPRVKFVGFVRLIEKEFKVDLSDLIEEYENYFGIEKKEKKLPPKEKTEIKLEKKEKNYLWMFVLGLFLISSFLYFGFFHKSKGKSKNLNLIETNKTFSEINNSLQKITPNLTDNFNEEQNQTNIENNTSKNNFSSVSSLNKITIPEKNETQQANKEYNITIIPNKLVWFRAINIDTKKTKEYLTTQTKILRGNYYIKFGHGDIVIIYNDQNITPNPKDMVRILFKNGKYQFLQKPNKYEK